MTETTITGSESHVDERNDVDSATDASDPGADGTPEAATHPNAEAAKYRVRAREAETALATAQARIGVLQRAEIERLASAGLSHPSDIFSLSGNDLVDYLTEDGTVDAERIATDVAAILAERPGLRKLDPAVDHSQGRGWNNPGKGEPSWGALLS